MKKTKRILSLILVMTMILSSVSVAFGTVTITEIPLRVKEWAQSPGENITIFTNSMGTFEVVDIDTTKASNDMLTFNPSTGVVSTELVCGNTLRSYVTYNNGLTWVTANTGEYSTILLDSVDFDIVYSDNDVLTPDVSNILYDSSTDNVVPFQSPANLDSYNLVLGMVTESDYTTESWSTYQGIVSANKVTKYNTQDEVDLATNNIAMAQEDLVLKTVETDLTAYNAALNAVNEEDYTPYSWGNYKSVVDSNVVTSSNTQEEVNTATNNITTAQIFLEPRADFSSYNALLTQVEEWAYTIASWAEYKGVVDSFIITLNSSQSEVDEAVIAIASAQANLVTKANLTNYIITLANVTESNYTPQSWSIYWAVVIMNEVSTENTQEEVNAAENNILAAQANLVPMADDTEYNAVIASVNESDYTIESWQAYQARLTELPVTVNLSQYELDGIVDEILIAQSTLLVLKPTGSDLTAYNTALLNVIESDYTSGSWEIYQAVVGGNVVATSNTQEEVNTATQNILIAQSNLVFYNKPNLDNAKFMFSELVETDYDHDSWALLTDVLQLDENTNADMGVKYNQMMYLMSILVRLPGDLTEYNALLTSVSYMDYTTESWEIYTMNVNSPECVMTTGNLNSEIAHAISMITTYQESLVPAVVDKTYLNEWKEALATYVQSDYTTSSWNLLQSALDLPESTNEEIVEKVTYIQAAVNGLVFANQGNLDIAMAAREGLIGEAYKYTAESFAVLINTGDMPESTNAEVGIKAQAILDAINGLVHMPLDFTAYNNALANVESVDYTSASWNQYAMVLSENTATEFSTQEQINIFTSNILLAQTNLVQKPADLTQYYLVLQNVYEPNFTEESLAIYHETLNAFPVSADMKQSVVAARTLEIFNAQQLLVVKTNTGNVTLMNYDGALASVNEEDYTPESWIEYMTVVDENIVTLQNTQEEIDLATDNIIEAQETILVLNIPEVDFSEYYMLLDFVVESDYTIDSWKAYTDIVEALGIDENSTQEEVDEAEFVIFNAQQNLIALENIEMYYKLTHIQNRGYTKESWTAYLDEVENNKLPENFSREELDMALNNLYQKTFTLRTLFTKENYDFIVKYAETHRSEFSEEDMNAFDELLGNTQITTESTPLEINAAVAILGMGFSQLNRIDGKANTLGYDLLASMTQEEMFTTDSWEEYITHLEGHGNISDMTTKEYEDVLRHIMFLQKFLVEKGDLAAYNTLLASVKPDNYTIDSWNTYQLVVKANVVNNNSSREEVNTAIANITNAKFKLVLKPIDTGSGGGGGGSVQPPAPPVIMPPVILPPVVVPPNPNLITIRLGESIVSLPVRETMALKDSISGYVNGYTDNTFKPNNSITRAETSQILSNIFKESGMLKPEATDIQGKWYSQSVEQVLSLGLMKGYEDKTFKPEKNITRQEFAVTLVNMLDLSKMPAVGDKTFTDVDSSYGKDSIKLLASLGILQGYDDGTFRPDTEITRAEVVVIINRLLGDRIPPQGNTGNIDINLIDLENCWAREDILRALKK